MVVFQKYRAINFETSFAAWAHQVLQNEILKFYRSQANRAKILVRDHDDSVSASTWNSDLELKRRMLECIKKICGAYIRYARILNLKYQGYTGEEICERLAITPNNFYSMVSRARSLLDTCLETGDVR